MSEKSRYNRGSEWRKWDLQIQPIKDEWFCDLENKCVEIKKATKEYLRGAVEKEISVVAITDHNCGLAIDAALDIIEANNFDITVLPGVEIDVQVGYQLIVIINPTYKKKIQKPTWKETIEHFLNHVCELSSPVINEQGQAKSINGDIHKLLEEICKEDIGLPLFAHCQSDKGLFKKTTDARRIEYFTNSLEGKYYFGLDHKSDANIAKTKETIEHWSFDVNKFAYIRTSDAHQASAVGDGFSWIKADPTYNGLKQIIYEPVERVKNQADNPSFEYNKPYFTQVDIEAKTAIFDEEKDQVYFCKKTLPLNKNLVAMIGGRGTGKSMLVDYWASIFTNNVPNGRFSSDGNFSVEYAKDNIMEPTTETYNGDNTNYLDFIYIPQTQLKEISSKERIEQEVKKLLDLENLYFSQDLNDEIQNVLENIDKLQNWFVEEDEEGRQLNQKSYVASLRTESEKLLNSITTKNNKEKLEKYTENIGAIQNLKNNIEYLDGLKQQLQQTQEELNQGIAEMNARLPKKDGYKDLEKVDFKVQLDTISENKKTAETQKQTKQGENEKIKKDFEEEGFTGDLSSLLKNAGTYQSQINWADKQLTVISKKETELSKELKKRDELSTKIKTEYENQKEKIDRAWENILEKHEGEHKGLIEEILLREGKISVEGQIVFNEGIFYDKILKIVDRRSYKNVAALKSRLKISNFEDWIRFVNEDLKEMIDGEESDRFEGIEDIIFGIKKRGEYLKTLPEISYDGRRLNRLSVGQRGTVYLCLKLATDAFSKPIIFDQPEDDLDNKFIASELIDIFRELKKYRQIIIVTHNANLVVNADAEQVIIASNSDEELTYESGSLENETIIDGVCEILEGGEEAFEKRKHKYRFA